MMTTVTLLLCNFPRSVKNALDSFVHTALLCAMHDIIHCVAYNMNALLSSV